MLSSSIWERKKVRREKVSEGDKKKTGKGEDMIGASRGEKVRGNEEQRYFKILHRLIGVAEENLQPRN